MCSVTELTSGYECKKGRYKVSSAQNMLSGREGEEGGGGGSKAEISRSVKQVPIMIRAGTPGKCTCGTVVSEENVEAVNERNQA